MASDDNLLKALICVSEKAANIARICRQNDHLLSLLVQEKKEADKNPRFLHDFKTLADVLVQEVIKFHLCQKFPDLIGNIFGEENNEFETNSETVIIEVKKNRNQTSQLLNGLLCDEEASELLAEVIHSDVSDDIECHFLERAALPENLGVWIDPIDSTGEYITGNHGESSGLVKSGLPCVTVLIGVFHKDSGEPIVGIVNQPFYKNVGGQWSGQYVYGVHYEDLRYSSPTFYEEKNKIVAVSSAEDDEIKNKLMENGYTTVELAGAGYKLLKLVTGEVQAYILSKPTTFLWDICACNAILKSIGGGIVNFHTFEPIYFKAGKGVSECCNDGGILAFRNEQIKFDLINLLRN